MMTFPASRDIVFDLRSNWDDILVTCFITFVAYYYIKFFYLPQKNEAGYHLFFQSPQEIVGLGGREEKPTTGRSRNLATAIQSSRLHGIILWGSQSGTSERLAKSFARMCQKSLGLKVIAADLDSFDHGSLSEVPSSSFVGFVVATYGEGDPTDNAVKLDDHLSGLSPAGSPLQALNHCIFGLGSSKYQHFNRFAHRTDEALVKAGSRRIEYLGERDESLRSDQSWNEWTTDVLNHLAQKYDTLLLEVGDDVPESGFEIVDMPGASVFPQILPVGDGQETPRGRSGWFTAPISEGQVISPSVERPNEMCKEYLHLEFDLKSVTTDVQYEAGDHLAIQPRNNDEEVDRFAGLFGWNKNTLKMPIDLRPASTEIPAYLPKIGLPTTREHLLRHYVDLCGIPTQDSLRVAAAMAPTQAATTKITELIGDTYRWTTEVIAGHLTIGRVLQLASADVTWPEALFAPLLQTLPPLQPRYFSIASSAKVDPHRVAITIGVVSTELTNRTFQGLMSTQLRDHCETQHGQVKMPMHIRTSGFKLSSDASRPVIMIAAGSGIAPFLGFAQERQHIARKGLAVGRMILFYGCRSADDDFLYRETWRKLEAESVVHIDVAESRARGRKEYVQDRLRIRSDEASSMLLKEEASVFVCGSVKMAQGVKEVLVASLVSRGFSVDEARRYMSGLKHGKRYLEDVWG